jgi:uncharacterized membrane protein YphA (DoxX/SURF4 family)
LGVIFIYAGVGKVLNPINFAHDIDNYRMLPYVLVSLMAIILPWVEIIAGLLLIFGRFLLGSSFVFMAMNLVFIIAISAALARGLDIDCGCFSLSAAGSKVGVVRLIEDIVFFVMAAVVFWQANKSDS